MNKKNAQANTKKSKGKKKEIKVKVNRFHIPIVKEITPGKARYLSTMLKDYVPPVCKTPKRATRVIGSAHFGFEKPKSYSIGDAAKALNRNKYYEEGSNKSVFAHVSEMIIVEADQADIVNMTQFTQKKLENEHKEAEFEKQRALNPRTKKAA